MVAKITLLIITGLSHRWLTIQNRSAGMRNKGKETMAQTNLRSHNRDIMKKVRPHRDHPHVNSEKPALTTFSFRSYKNETIQKYSVIYNSCCLK